MTPSSKLHLGSAGYYAVLTGLNWYRSVEYARKPGVTGMTSETLSPVALALVIFASGFDLF